MFTDILSFAISDRSDTFIEVMNQDEISFKSQFILESLVKKDPGLTFNLAHDSDNKVTGIVWMLSYMRDNFERFDEYTSIDGIHLFICNAKGFYYIAPVIKNEVGKINIVCEGFFISETHDASTFVLDSLFKMCTHGGGEDFHAVFSDEFMT